MITSEKAQSPRQRTLNEIADMAPIQAGTTARQQNGRVRINRTQWLVLGFALTAWVRWS